MSYILDALKKSEQERARERGPTLASVHNGWRPEAGRPRFIGVGLSVLLLVSLLALGGGLAWHYAPELLSRIGATQGIEQNAVAPFKSVPAAPGKAVPEAKAVPKESSAGAGEGAPEPLGQPDPEAKPEPANAASGSKSGSGPSSEPGAEPGSETGAEMRAVQELWELPDPVRADFPALTFSFHVYAQAPERRAIIINNRRLREGEAVTSELRLERITEDGVIMAFRGHRVHIPVVQGW